MTVKFMLAYPVFLIVTLPKFKLVKKVSYVMHLLF